MDSIRRQGCVVYNNLRDRVILQGTPYPFGRGDYDVVILAGQSNVVGYQDIGDLPVGYQGSNRDVKFMRGNSRLTFFDSTDSNTYQNPQIDTRWAAQTPLMWKLTDEYGELLFLQEAVGNTGFDDEWRDSGVNYQRLIQKIVNLRGNFGGRLNFKCMVFAQGEKDAFISSASTYYETRLGELVSAVRTATGEANLPVVIARLNSNCPRTYAGDVITAQNDWVASDANGYIADVDLCQLDTDNIHYTPTGYDCYANAVKSVIDTNELI